MYMDSGEDGFRVSVTAVVLNGGHIAETILGIFAEYQNLPKVWVGNINGALKRKLDSRLNNLFNLMGVL